MGAMKEMWLIVHEALIEEYVFDHPEATTEEAANATLGMVEDRIADLGDFH